MEKRYLQLKAAAGHSECPWNSVQAARGADYRSAARKDSSGNVTEPGDPEMANVFVQLASGGPLMVDMKRLGELMEQRRAGAVEAA